ncbi:hypothetical protein D3C78_1556120 [compost metagenome]
MLGAGAGLDQIQLQFHLPLGALDGGEQAGEELLAVDQQLETVAAAPGKDGLGHGAPGWGRMVGLGIGSSDDSGSAHHSRPFVGAQDTRPANDDAGGPEGAAGVGLAAETQRGRV